jgi:hypothetical protein
VKTPHVISSMSLKQKFHYEKKILETLIDDSLNLKDNFKEIELGGHQVVKTLELISKSHGMKKLLL